MNNRVNNNFNKYWLSFITFVGIFLFALGIVGSERLIPILERTFHLKHWKAGVIISANLIGFLIAILTGGILSDFIPRKYLIITGFALLSAGAITFGFLQTYLALLIGNFLIGLSGGFLEGLLSLVIMDIFANKRGMALNLSQVFFGLGAGSAPFLVMAFTHWRIFYLIITISSFVTLLISLPQKFPEVFDNSAEIPEKKIKLLRLFINKRFLLTILAMFFYSCTEMGIASWISDLFAKYYHSSRLMATLSLSSYWGAQLIGRSTIGLKVDKFKSERFISILFFISSFFLFFALIFDRMIVSYIFFSLSGLSMAPIWPTILSNARNNFNDFPGTAFGVIAASGAGAGIIVPPFIGRLADIYTIRIALSIIILTSILGGILYKFIEKVSPTEGQRLK